MERNNFMKDNLSAFSSRDYDSRISSVLPYYHEFHTQIIDIAKTLYYDGFRWLDTGCGTGTLACRVLGEFNDVYMTLCDPSAEMLDKAKNNLGETNITYRRVPSQQLDYKNEFDIVTAVQSHHYLDRETRFTATKKCYESLVNGGVYITFENTALSSPQSERIGIDRWSRYLRANGKSEVEVKSHIARRGIEVFPITVEEHLKLIRECGFKSVDILWMSYMQTGFFAIK